MATTTGFNIDLQCMVIMSLDTGAEGLNVEVATVVFLASIFD
jgi:hypothetical protein